MATKTSSRGSAPGILTTDDEADGALAYRLEDGVFKRAVISALRFAGWQGTIDEFCRSHLANGSSASLGHRTLPSSSTRSTAATSPASLASSSPSSSRQAPRRRARADRHLALLGCALRRPAQPPRHRHDEHRRSQRRGPGRRAAAALRVRGARPTAVVARLRDGGKDRSRRDAADDQPPHREAPRSRSLHRPRLLPRLEEGPDGRRAPARLPQQGAALAPRALLR
jgi:hypothetical protein